MQQKSCQLLLRGVTGMHTVTLELLIAEPVEEAYLALLSSTWYTPVLPACCYACWMEWH
jgi:hypothetical protein